MNTYEVLIIFKPILDVENVDNVINHFQKNIVEANQGEVAEMDRIGRKRLAYEVKKFKDGFLTLFLLKFPPAKVADFRRACQLNDDILRVTLVSQDNIPQRQMLKEEGPPRREEAGGRFRGRFQGGGGGGFQGGGGGGFQGGGGGNFQRNDGPPPRRDFAPQQQPPQAPAQA